MQTSIDPINRLLDIIYTWRNNGILILVLCTVSIQCISIFCIAGISINMVFIWWVSLNYVDDPKRNSIGCTYNIILNHSYLFDYFDECFFCISTVPLIHFSLGYCTLADFSILAYIVSVLLTSLWQCFNKEFMSFFIFSGEIIADILVYFSINKMKCWTHLDVFISSLHAGEWLKIAPTETMFLITILKSYRFSSQIFTMTSCVKNPFLR